MRGLTGGVCLVRATPLIVTVVGAAVSAVLMLRAGQRTPRFLLGLFFIWVLSPFVALAWANMISKRWSLVTRATL
jgi:phosphate/sulfate permease